MTVQLFVLELRDALLACLLVLLAVCFLTVHSAVLDKATGRAVPELGGVAPELAAVGAGSTAILVFFDRLAAVHGSDWKEQWGLKIHTSTSVEITA